MRFRVNDRVSVSIKGTTANVEGMVKLVDTETEGDTAEVKFLILYDVAIDGHTEGFHTADELRLVHGAEDTRPPLEAVSVKEPSMSDYRDKLTARMNTIYDALYCKSEVEESWVRRVTPKGVYQLQMALSSMSLRDIYELYGEISAQVFILMVLGDNPRRLEESRNLAREMMHAVLCYGCFMNYDGNAKDRFRKMMDERIREYGEGRGSGEGD